ncbi:MAG: hypothetical protein NT091_05225, partial [Candidatus Falkowbacteria bacterium]|nr:hypothetical protein [Candidatus Falkowbacteria bacterium]
VIVSGSVEIQNNDLYEKNPIFNSDSIISKDTTMASEGVDNVRVVALEETLIYIINGETMDQLKQDIPWLSNTIGNAM